MRYDPAVEAVLDGILSGDPRLRRGKMFGYPAYYAGKKLCICLYEGGVGLKLPGETADRLLATDPNVSAFRPMGKPAMRAWIRIDLPAPGDFARYRAVFDESVRHVYALGETP